MTDTQAMFEWTLEVDRRNEYGDKVVATTPAVVIAPTMQAATDKARAAFGATWDGFRKIWSHGVRIKSMREVPQGARPAALPASDVPACMADGVGR